MSRRTRLIIGVAGTLILLLFGGRWVTLLLAERWWADSISPEAGRFLTQTHLLQFFLDLAGVLVGSAWFVGNFFVVYRAIGSVHVSRRVANLEIHEALTPRVLLLIAIGAGILLGMLTGLGLSRWWPSVLLAWHGLAYNVPDPLTGRDLGVFVAQLPLWRRLHGFALLLVLLGLASCILLYVIVGAVRWTSRRPAVSDHARRHIGWLLGALALTLAWGYWLEPYESVAGLGGSFEGDTASFMETISSALTGVALSAALISVLWAFRPRHLLMVMGWMILALSSILGHHVLPFAAAGRDRQPVDDAGIRRMEEIAFGMNAVTDSPPSLPRSPAGVPGPISLWSQRIIEQLGEGDSTTIVATNQSVLRTRGRRLPAWITVRVRPGESAFVTAYADDRTSFAGGPTSYRLADTLAYPGSVRLLELPATAVRPAAPEYAVTQDSSGVRIGAWGRRIMLAWARQAGALLGRLPPSARLAWHLDPRERLGTLAPHIQWSNPTAHIIDGDLAWLADGYVTSNSFPIVDRAPWGEREVSSVDAALLGVVKAGRGETRIYRRPSAGPLGKAWQDITGEMARPWTELDPAILAQLTYPETSFHVQARVLERPHWLGNRLAGHTTDRISDLANSTWHQADTSLALVELYEAAGGQGITAILQGLQGSVGPELVITRLHGEEVLGAPSALIRNWERFATYEQLRDSLRSAGAEAEPGPVGVWIDRDRVGADQVIYGIGPDRRIAVAWVNIAARDSLGAGRTLLDAWQNLLGVSAPLLGGGTSGRLAEAERWMAIADSALRRGDWSGFGRAFDALRVVLGQGSRDPLPRPPAPR